MANKAVVVLDKLLAGYNGHLYSITSEAEMQNGMLFAVDGLATVEVAGTDASGEVFTTKKIADIAPATDVFVLHASPEVIYNQGYWLQNDGTILEANDLTQFSVPAGKVGRAYGLNVGDIVTVADSLISGATVKGQYVIPGSDTDTKTMKVAADLTAVGTSRLVFKVLKKKTIGVGRFGVGTNGQASTVLMVVKA